MSQYSPHHKFRVDKVFRPSNWEIQRSRKCNWAAKRSSQAVISLFSYTNSSHTSYSFYYFFLTSEGVKAHGFFTSTVKWTYTGSRWGPGWAVAPWAGDWAPVWGCDGGRSGMWWDGQRKRPERKMWRRGAGRQPPVPSGCTGSTPHHWAKH